MFTLLKNFFLVVLKPNTVENTMHNKKLKLSIKNLYESISL